MVARHLLLSTLAILAVAGCRSALPVAPESADPPVRMGARSAAATPPRSAGLYPLADGNRWEYQATFTQRYEYPDRPAETRIHVRFRIVLHQTCVVDAHGRSYRVERKIETFEDGAEAVSHSRWREDHDGLWGAQLGTEDPCVGSSDPGPENERRRLAYPLHPGQRWQVAPGFFPEVDSVEVAETLFLPVGPIPAWRIRVDRPGVWERGKDRSHVWYSRWGLLKLVTHIEDDLVEDGRVVGTIVAEHTQTLESIHLAPPGRFAGALR
jgi:hypothetical protein